MQSPLFTPEFLLLTGPVWLQISLLWPAVLSEAFLAIPTPLDKDGLFCLGWCRKGHKKKSYGEVSWQKREHRQATETCKYSPLSYLVLLKPCVTRWVNFTKGKREAKSEEQRQSRGQAPFTRTQAVTGCSSSESEQKSVTVSCHFSSEGSAGMEPARRETTLPGP